MHLIGIHYIKPTKNQNKPFQYFPTWPSPRPPHHQRINGIKMENENQIIYFNELGIKYLENNPAHSIFYLNQALLKTRCLSQSQNRNKLLAMTYNNLGCYYNNSKNSTKALEFFQKSAKLGHIKGSDNKSTAYAHLNIAGILSSEGQHEKSLRHALKSVRYLKQCPESTAKTSLTLVSAYQMIGMEYFSLGQSADAKSSMETALEICLKNLGKKHEKYVEIEEFLNKNFRLKSSFAKNRAGSVQGARNLTPIHVNNRTLKNRLSSFVKDYSGSVERSTSKPRPKKWARFIVKSGDVSYIRKLEFSAACKVQSWWRGILARRAFKEDSIKKDLKKAEWKAKEAFEEVERLKGLLAKNSTRTSQVSSAENFYGDFIISRKLSVERFHGTQIINLK